MSQSHERGDGILPSATYKEAYARLSAIADRLKSQAGAADVDSLPTNPGILSSLSEGQAGKSYAAAPIHADIYVL